MINLAGNEMCDYYIQVELEEAGIEIVKLGIVMPTEVPTCIFGRVGDWYFKRNWGYWVAMAEEEGKGIPQSEAKVLNAKWRGEVRVNGYVGGTDVLRWLSSAGTVDTYHIDSQRGLDALVKLIRELLGNQ